jgi:3-deoxy-D-manno-octulosonate 8-phosphate phosphatase (KDO 8-P phosphatase)
MTFPKDLLRRAGQIKLFVSDVDGVWTNGTVTVHADGTESVTFSIHDGLGVVRLLRAGLEVAVISGRRNPAVEYRARRLGIEEVHVGVHDKEPLLQEMMEARGLKKDQVAAIGDDLPDLQMFALAGLCLAPPAAVPEVRERADWITRAGGGLGALREACNLLLEGRRGAAG